MLSEPPGQPRPPLPHALSRQHGADSSMAHGANGNMEQTAACSPTFEVTASLRAWPIQSTEQGLGGRSHRSSCMHGTTFEHLSLRTATDEQLQPALLCCCSQQHNTAACSSARQASAFAGHGPAGSITTVGQLPTWVCQPAGPVTTFWSTALDPSLF